MKLPLLLTVATLVASAPDEASLLQRVKVDKHTATYDPIQAARSARWKKVQGEIFDNVRGEVVKQSLSPFSPEHVTEPVDENNPGASYKTPPGCLDGPAKPEPVNGNTDRPFGRCQKPMFTKDYDPEDYVTFGPRDWRGCQFCRCVHDKTSMWGDWGKWQCTGMPRIRKEIKDVTDKEFDKFADAVNTLKRHGDWDAQAALHINVEGQAHGNNRFGHWHRKYLYDVETLIQAAANDCSVTLPYWNWALDNGPVAAAAPYIFGPTRYGSLVHPNIQRCGLEFCGFGRPGDLEQDDARCFFRDGQAVADGKFGPDSAFGQAEFDSEAQPLEQFGPLKRCYRGDADNLVPINTAPLSTLEANLERHFKIGSDRRFGPNFDPAQGPGGGATTFEEEFEGPFGRVRRGVPAQFVGFVQYLEEVWHNGVHCAIGGYMCNSASPYDPVFFAHHAFVDKIWYDWQEEHLSLEGNDRYWSQDNGAYDLPLLVCHDGATSIPSADVEVSDHMVGTMNGAVTYFDRQEDFGCGESFPGVHCCMKALTLAGRWHEVARVRSAPTEVHDLCSPNNDMTIENNVQWFTHMVAAGLKDTGKNVSLAQHVPDVPNVFPASSFPNLQECEKKLCFLTESGEDTHNLFGLCRSLQAGLPEDEKCPGPV